MATALAAMIERPDAFDAGGVDVSDAVLGPGYGRLNDAVGEAMAVAARQEGLLLDPVYILRADQPARPRLRPRSCRCPKLRSIFANRMPNRGIEQTAKFGSRPANSATASCQVRQ